MEGLLPLAVILGASGSLLAFHKKKKEPFQDLVNPAVEQALGSSHANFIRKSAEKYNPIANTMNPLENPLVEPDATPGQIAESEKKVQAALQTAEAKPGQNNYTIKSTNVSDILLNKSAKGTGIRRVAQCEKVKTMDCSAFDDPAFSNNCGICLEDGRDSGGNPMVGGLFILEEDKFTSEENSKRMNSRRVNYKPAVGSCKPFMFAVDKEQCMKIKAQMECAKKQNYEVPGCSSCVADEKFYFLQDGYIKTQPALFIQGKGACILKRPGQEDKKVDLSTSPTRFELVGMNEGDTFTLAVDGEDSFISGYMEGTTPTGSFRIDIMRLAQADTVTGTRPRLAGMQEMGGENMSLIRPGRGKTSMSLSILNPFTFIEPTEEEAQQCASAPFVTKESSMNFLNSSPCYKKGQGPGKYSLECLQQTFESAGCTAEGTAYPSTTERAQALMVDGFGRMRSIGQIAQRIYDASLAAATGKTKEGRQMSIEQWNAESTFCTGKKITSPCDVMDPKGSISTDCLVYLWNNSGAYQTIAGGPGNTYTNGLSSTSLDAKDRNRYCTANGSMSPIGKNGLPNEEAIRIARSKGTIQQIKEFYNSIHKTANDNTKDIVLRKEAIQQCYGIGVKDMAALIQQGPTVDIGDTNQYVSVLDSKSGRMKTIPESKFKYRGCWKDDGARPLPTRLPNVSTKEQCEAQAIAGGFDAYGLQYYGECWAGKNAPWNRAGAASADKCPPLGGFLTQHVYSINDAPVPPTPPPPTPKFTNLNVFNPKNSKNVAVLTSPSLITMSTGGSTVIMNVNVIAGSGSSYNGPITIDIRLSMALGRQGDGITPGSGRYAQIQFDQAGSGNDVVYTLDNIRSQQGPLRYDAGSLTIKGTVQVKSRIMVAFIVRDRFQQDIFNYVANGTVSLS